MSKAAYLLPVALMLAPALSLGKNSNVILEHSETLSFNKESGRDCQVLKGNVRFRHENAVMYCDSAYFYDQKNSFDAFGNVRVLQDTMSMTSNTMYYDGETKIMRVRGEAVLKNGQMTLYTDWLDYYREADYGYYADGGKLIDPEFTLTSDIGYYYPKSKLSYFKKNVELVNPEYTIHTDSLKFNQKANIAWVIGESEIVYADYTINTTYGWINTATKYGQLYNRSTIVGSKGTFATADSMYFDKATGKMEMFGDAVALDDSSHTGFSGDYAWMNNEKKEGFITSRACMMDYSDPQDTMFLHGDTIQFFSDTLTKQKTLYAFHHVKLFGEQMQGRCDSLTYLETDSMIRLDGNPVIWADDSQMSGDTIKIYTDGQHPDWIHIQNNAFITQQQAKSAFDQVSGKECKAYLADGKLRQMDMVGNAISMYYAQDDFNKLIGVNRCQGPMLTIFLKDNKMEKILMTPESKGIMFPPGQVPEGESFLRGFNWRDKEKPKCKADVFK